MSAVAMSYCVSFDVAYLQGLNDDELGRCLQHKETKQPMSAAECRGYLAALADRGYEMVPVCDNADDKGRCQGHPVEPGPQPVPLRFCEPARLVDDLRTLKGLGLSREGYDAGARPIIGMMTRGFTHWPRCGNHDIHGLCLGHPEGEGGGA